MTLVLTFELPSDVGITVEECLRPVLEPHFSELELVTRPRYTVFIDDEGRVTSSPTVYFRLTAGLPTHSLGPGDLTHLEQAIHDCFFTARVPGEYSLEWLE